jgi:hypothetical protein
VWGGAVRVKIAPVLNSKARATDMSKLKWKHPNAQKHAVFSKFLILPGENPREFDKLMDELAGEWKPEGKTEHDALFEIGKGIWLKRRQ